MLSTAVAATLTAIPPSVLPSKHRWGCWLSFKALQHTFSIINKPSVPNTWHKWIDATGIMLNVRRLMAECLHVFQPLMLYCIPRLFKDAQDRVG